MCQETPETDGGSATEVVEEKPGGIGGFLKGIFGGGKKVENSESTPAPSEEPGSGETGVENSQEVDVPETPETDGGSATVVEEKPRRNRRIPERNIRRWKKRRKLGANPCPIRGTESGETGIENSPGSGCTETTETDGGSAIEVVEEKPGGIGGFLKGIFGGGKKVESSESTLTSGDSGKRRNKRRK